MTATETGTFRPEPPSLPNVWVDSHLMLNVLAVLRHRMQSQRPDALDVLDAISTYFANGQYLHARDSVARLDYWIDWFEACVGMLHAAHKLVPMPVVDIDIDMGDAAFELSGLREASLCFLDRLAAAPAGDVRAVTVRLRGDDLLLMATGDSVGSEMRRGPLPSAVQLDAGHPAALVLRLRPA